MGWRWQSAGAGEGAEIVHQEIDQPDLRHEGNNRRNHGCEQVAAAIPLKVSNDGDRDHGLQNQQEPGAQHGKQRINAEIGLGVGDH